MINSRIGRRSLLSLIAVIPFCVSVKKKTRRRSIGLCDRNGKTIREGDRFRCRTHSYLHPELEGVIKWAKYKAGYTLQNGDRSIAGFRDSCLPCIKEIPGGRIDGEVLS